jgi:branched-chain amino acid aminotransferase
VLDSAEEIFLLSTTRNVQAVHRWNDRDLEAPGPVTGQLMELWASREAEDVDP